MFSVPQDSVLGPLLFSLYTTPLSKVIERLFKRLLKDIPFHVYANKTQLFVNMSQKYVALAFGKLNSFLWDVRECLLVWYS